MRIKLLQKISGGLLLVLLSCSSLLAQEKEINGVVVDQTTGQGLSGAVVSIKGEPSNVSADVLGKFKIRVTPADSILVVSYIGYKRTQVNIAGQDYVTIKMNSESQDLSDVVVVGYGQQKKIALTGSVSTVDMKKIEDFPSLNLASSLVGQVNGLSINTATQRPGGAVGLTIRNPQNLSKNGNGSGTLYIIDDVVRTASDFNLLDPNEIESISVLKDAEAAIYGIDGANGAIVVRTKKGEIGKPKFSVSGSFGTANATQLPKMLTGLQLATWNNDYNQTANNYTIDSAGYIGGSVTKKLAAWYTPDELAYFANPANNTDYLAQAFKPANVERISMNVSGGTNKVRYFIGGDYVNQNSNFSGVNSYKVGLRANVEANLARGLMVSLNLSNTMSYSRNFWYKTSGTTESLDQDVTSLAEVAPWQKYFIDGNPVLLNTSYNGNTDIDNVNVFLFENSNNYTKSLNYVMNALGKISYEIPGIKGLTAAVSFNENVNFGFPKQYGTSFNYYQYSGLGENNHIPGGTILKEVNIKNGDRVRITPNYATVYQLDGTLTYHKTFGKNHLNLLGIYEQTEQYNEGVNAEADGVIITGLDNQNFTIGTQSSNQASSIAESGKLSYIGRANYDYDNTYLLEAVFRRDGSTSLPPANRYGNFGSVSAGWVLSNEHFIKDHFSFFDLLKLRASLGFTGSDNTVPYGYAQAYQYGTGSGGGAVFNEGERGLGIKATNIPNPYATWDHQTKTDYGLDMAFLHNRLSFTGDYYWNHNYDLLTGLSSSVPATIGLTTPNENYGIINAFGYELSVGWHDNIDKDWSYNVTSFFSWMDDKNIREDLATGLIGTIQDHQGKSDDQGVFGYDYVGMFRTQAQVDAFMTAHPGYTIFGQTPEVGMLNYKDLNGDNQITADGNDQEYLSHKASNHNNLGFNFGVTFKSLSINVVSGMSWGGQAVIPGNEITSSVAKDITQNRPAFWADHWTPDNTNAKYPAPYWMSDYNVTSNFWFVSAFSAQIQNVNISYTIPQKWSSRAGIASARFYAVCTNALNLFNPYPDNYRDPNTGILQYPNLRTFSFGLNIGL
ncbi:SusC/RagA family TonB-linked outer membrane protein [Arachidicoccus soli]|nr:SusC/RagA family TonB-linked outer membrane protein [Arachidicoccus soli]